MAEQDRPVTDTPPLDVASDGGGTATAAKKRMEEIGKLLKLYGRDIHSVDDACTSSDTAPLVEEPAAAAAAAAEEDDQSGKWMRLDPTGYSPFFTMLQQLITGGGQGDEHQLDLEQEIEQFVPAMQSCFQNAYGRSLEPTIQDNYRSLIRSWNQSLQFAPGWQYSTAIISWDIDKHIEKFISDGEFSALAKMAYKNLLPCWNKYLQARKGQFRVSKGSLFFTVLGLVLYVTDLVSDLVTAGIFASRGAWWPCALTLLLVYAAIAVSTVEKSLHWHVLWTSALDKCRVLASLLVNWPDLRQYWALCRLEWRLVTRLDANAHLVPEWEHRRLNVAQLKFTEGIWEACPQAILQMWLLLPDLQGEFTLIIIFRLASTTMSLCSAGAALINWEKKFRIVMQNDLPLLPDLMVLHAWAVPVTVARLLAMALLLRLHLGGGLACLALHLVLYSVYRYRTDRVPWLRVFLFQICLASLQYLISPFLPSVTFLHVVRRHAVHFACNSVVLAVWTLHTPLTGAILAGILGFSCAMMAVGAVIMVLYEWHLQAKQKKGTAAAAAGAKNGYHEVIGPTGVRMTGHDIALGNDECVDMASIQKKLASLDTDGATIEEI